MQQQPQQHPAMDLITSFFFLPQLNNHHVHGLEPVNTVTAGPCKQGRRRTGDERKERRLASNRESARRSRARLRRRMDELSSHVGHLRAANRRLILELNHMMAKHGQMVQENARLREEACGLQERLSELVLN